MLSWQIDSHIWEYDIAVRIKYFVYVEKLYTSSLGDLLITAEQNKEILSTAGN